MMFRDPCCYCQVELCYRGSGMSTDYDGDDEQNISQTRSADEDGSEKSKKNDSIVLETLLMLGGLLS